MKMIKTAYSHKQQQLKAQTKERLDKHRKTVEAVEMNKAKRLQRQKKEVFRIKSKAKIREENRLQKGKRSS